MRVSPDYRDKWARLASDSRTLRVVQRLAGHAAADPRAEDVDHDWRVDRNLGRDVGVGDRALHRVAVAAARHAADDLAADAHRLRAQNHRARLVEDQTCEARLRRRLAFLDEGVPPNELALVELDAEAEPRRVGVDLGTDIRAPDAVSLLETQRIDSLVPAGSEVVVVARLAEGVPQPQPVLGRAVKLPSQLSHVRHPLRQARHRSDGDLLRGHEWKGRVAEVRRSRLLQDGASIRTPEPDARVRGRDVLDVDRAIGGRLVADPRQVVHAEG